MAERVDALAGLVSWSLLGHRPLQERVANDIDGGRNLPSRNAAVLFHTDRLAQLRQLTRGPDRIPGVEAWVSWNRCCDRASGHPALGLAEQATACHRWCWRTGSASRDVLGGPAPAALCAGRGASRTVTSQQGKRRLSRMTTDWSSRKGPALSPAVEIPMAELGPCG